MMTTETMTKYEFIEVSVNNGVAVVNLNHPPLNILTEKIMQDMTSVLGEIDRNRDVRAVAVIPEDLIVPNSKVYYQLFRNSNCEEAGHEVNFDQKVDVKNSSILSPSHPPIH